MKKKYIFSQVVEGNEVHEVNFVIDERSYRAILERNEHLQTLIKQRDQTINELTLKIGELLAAKEACKNGESRCAEHEVEKILKVRHLKNGETEFLIRWKDYSPNSDSWEPESNLSCNELLTKFLDKKKSGGDDEADEDDADDGELDDDGDDDVSDVDEVDENDSSVNEVDDKKDADYNAADARGVAPEPTNERRRSIRTPKPIQPLMYKPKPVCSTCKTKLFELAGVDGPFFCSQKCLAKFEKKRSNQ